MVRKEGKASPRPLLLLNCKKALVVYNFKHMIFTTEDIILYALISFSALILAWLVRLEVKSKDIAIMKDKESLRNKLTSIENKLEDLHKFGDKTVEKMQNLESKLGNNLQNVEVIRFNPFKNDGVGGDQSFATTLLNKKGDGVIISSLYARENVRVFAKPIENWGSKYELSEEEKTVLNKTKAQI
jgi:hypothetical protein